MRPGTHARRAAAGLAAVGALSVAAAEASAQLSDEVLAAIEARVAPTVPASPTLELAAGDTRFVVHRAALPPRLRDLDLDDVEAHVYAVRTPRTVVVHPRADRLAVRDGVLVWVVPIHAAVTADAGGDVEYELDLMERRGLGDSLLRMSARTRVEVIATRQLTRSDLARDFAGYRRHRARARAAAKRLGAVGVRVSLEEDGPLPPTTTLRARGLALLRGFISDRYRMHAAARHLQHARRFAAPELQALAGSFWRQRYAPRARLGALAQIPLLPPDGAKPEPGPGPEPPAASTSEPAEDGVLEPLATFTPGSERPEVAEDEDPFRPPAPEPPPPDPEEASATGASPGVPPVTEATGRPGREADTELRRAAAGDDEPETIPNQRRGLTLDDPNVGFGGSVRFTWAEARVRESATTAALFFFTQAALTRDLGVEVTVPTQYVSLHDIDAESVYANGNPLLAAKYRFHLPAWAGSAPALTIRARLGVPWSPPSKLRPSDFLAEDLSRQVHFVDTWAFLPDFWDVGAGASLSWGFEGLTLQSQLYLDYLFPLDEAERDLVALSYGAGVGYAPWRWISGWVEARATSLLTGFSRTEMVAYAGARARLWDLLEPAVFVGVPVGSIADTSSVQLGAELRIAYDRAATTGTAQRRRPPARGRF